MAMRLPVKIYYEDTDCIGVVYYANYLKYLERGRTEYIGSLGRPIESWNHDGYNFVVFKMDITFHKPAKLGDLCEVVTKVVPATPFRLMMPQRIERDGELLTEALVTLVCIDKDLEVQEFPEFILEHAAEQER